MNIKELAEKVSPLPWKKTEHNARIIVSSNNSHYAACGGGSQEELRNNARMLCHSLNNILPLVEAVEVLMLVMVQSYVCIPAPDPLCKATKAVLAALENAQEVE